MSDTEIEERASLIDHYFFLHEDIELIRLGKMLLWQYSADWLEHQVCGSLLFPLLRQGLVEDAMQLHLRIYRHSEPYLRGSSWYWGLHLAFQALTGNLAVALQLFEKSIGKVLERPDMLGQLMFYLPTIIVVDRLILEQQGSIYLRLPDSVPIYHLDGRYEPSVLRDWIHREALTTAERFDARNGTDYYCNEVKLHREMQQYFTPVPLPRK